MYAVGRLGSYITQGVYTVSGPFHPFGGAVDMVVVQQQDGSLKSSPWYVRFGKFQGVLKAKERVVDINVNGVDADFHMYLDPRGEAYFLREIDSEEIVETVSSHSSSHEEMNGKGQDMITVKTKSMNYDFDQCNSVNDVSNGEVLSRTNSKRSRILRFVLGRRSMKEHIISKEENNSNVGRMGSLESAEIAADLLEMRWSTNLSSRSRDSRNDNEDITGGRLEGSLVLHEQHFVNKLESSGVNHEVPAMEVKETIVADVVHDVNENVDEEVPSMEVKETIVADVVHDVNENDDEEVPSMEVKETIVADVVHDVNENVDEEVPSMEVKETIVADVHDVNENVDEEGLRNQLDDSKEAEVGLITAQGFLEIVPESYTEVASNQGDTSLEVVACNSIAVPICQNEDDNLTKEVNETNENRAPMNSNGEFQDVSADSVLMEQVNEEFVEEHLIFGDLDESKPSINQVDQEVKQGGIESMSITYGSDSLTVRTYQEPFKNDIETVKGNIRRCPTNLDIPKSCEVTEVEVGRQAKSLPNMWCQFNDPVPENHEESQFYSPVGKFRSSNWDLLREDASRIKKTNLEKELPLNADNLSKDLQDGSIASGGAPNIVDGAGGSWRLWPFTRLGSKNVSEKEQNSKKDSVDNLPETDGEKEEISPKSDKTHTRALTPTPEQLASLNLAEGQNSVTFTFSTSVLGPQKVDARIYLWRWDSRIVISDVDGTITKSDVLGQFMPLVGRDWSHIGVTHLFSAIKENGYQMLYLSARAISQASITRQFLFNLKQDGKALPDGPVVISPDGLFPSLFREVIRRAPHEFKIACLEDIKACFPHDRNPFYAGFGNRDTDEFSYLKVGIPKGKIFIINPKGEVVINRCIDSKSYASLHALVNGIFPPISVQEEEDYNSWNFWKLPPPTIE